MPDFNYFTLAALGVGVLVVVFLVVHFWPKLKGLVKVSPRVSKELDREHIDLEAFLNDFDRLRAKLVQKNLAAAVPPTAAPSSAVASGETLHAEIDRDIERLLAKKEAMVKAQAAFDAAQQELARVAAL
jgi:hypothetical protein